MKKRRLVTLGVFVLLAISLFGCGAKKVNSEKRNTLLQNVTNDISAVRLYRYDGESGEIYITHDNEGVEEILTDISGVEIKENEGWSQDKLAFPVYGLAITDSNGDSVEMAFSNGYCVTMNESVYTFEYEFEELISDHKWDGWYAFTRSTILPCARELSIGEGAWITSMLIPAEELVALLFTRPYSAKSKLH